MNSDQHKPSVLANPQSGDVQIHSGTDVQATVGYLPEAESIDPDDHAPIALAEGYDSLAVELAYESSEIAPDGTDHRGCRYGDLLFPDGALF
jgi:hypothetical protein